MSRRIDTLVIHHSASLSTTTIEDIRRWHLERGFKDVGYHFVIEANGAIRHGRPVEQVGAHVQGHNKNTVGICVVGNNMRPEERWNPTQIARLRELVLTLRTLWPGVNVLGHRDLANTVCPGVDVSKLGL